MGELKFVNRKQFHYLLTKFLYEHRLHDVWFQESRDFKIELGGIGFAMLTKYGLKKEDNFNVYLYKSIETYITERKAYNLYDGTIRGFFRFIPSGGLSGKRWYLFWSPISKIWEEKYRNVRYKYNG
jgi:hypothetical protein